MEACGLRWTERILAVLGLLTIPLHLHNCVACIFPWVNSSPGSAYPPEAYGASLLWLAIVLVMDGFLIWKRRFVLARVFSWYWALSCVLLGLALLNVGPPMLYALSGFLTPRVVLVPLLGLLPGVSTDVDGMMVTFFFCLLQWGLCRFLPGQEKRT